MPEPLRPMIATRSPEPICAWSPSRTRCTRPPSRKLRESCRISSTVALYRTMSESEWRLLTTLTDQPSAQSLAGILEAEGIAVRVSSDAGVLGQAAPSRIYVNATQFQRAKNSLAQRQFSDEELTVLSAGLMPADEGK